MDDLYELTLQNNIMLRQILKIIQNEADTDFIGNVAANLIASSLERNVRKF